MPALAAAPYGIALKKDHGSLTLTCEHDLTDSVRITLGDFPATSREFYTVSGRLSSPSGLGKSASARVELHWLDSKDDDVSTVDVTLGYFDRTLVEPLPPGWTGDELKVKLAGVAATTSLDKGRVSIVLSGFKRGEAVRLSDFDVLSGLPPITTTDGHAPNEDDGPLTNTPEPGFTYSTNLFPGFLPEKTKETDRLSPAVLLQSPDEVRTTPLMAITPGSPIWISYWLKFNEHAMTRGFRGPLQVRFYRLDTDGSYSAVGERSAILFGNGSLVDLHGTRFLNVLGPITPPTGATHLRLVTLYQDKLSVNWEARPRIANWGQIRIDGVSVWQAPAVSASGDWQATPYGAFFATARNTTPAFYPVPDIRENSVSLFNIRQPDANLFFVEDGAAPRLELGAGNLLPLKRTLSLEATIVDWEGKVVNTLRTSIALAPYELKDIPLEPGVPPAFGAYQINLKATEGDRVCMETSTRFAWLHRPVRDDSVRLSDEYPFGIHPRRIQVDPEGNSDRADNDFQLRLLRLMGVNSIRLQSRFYGLDLNDPEASAIGARTKVERWRTDILPLMRKYRIKGWVSFMEQRRGWSPRNAAEMKAWHRYNYEQVKAFGDDVEFFIYGNEGLGRHTPTDPDESAWPRSGYDGTPRQWMAAYQDVYDAAHEANPDVLIGPSHAGDPNAHVARQFNQILGKNGRFDIWGFNIYGDAAQAGLNIYKQLKADGRTPKFGVIPEVGLSVSATGLARIPGEQRQARAMVQTYVTTKALAPWVRHISWFIIQGGRARDENHQMFDYDWSPRPVAAAYLVLSDILGAGHVERAIEVSGGGEFYVWRKIDGSVVGIGWSSSESAVTLDTGSTTIDIADMFGNRRTETTKDGAVVVPLSVNPSFVLGADHLLKSDAVEVTIRHASVKTGPDRTLALDIRNNTKTRQQVTVANETPPPVMVRPGSLTVDLLPGESATKELKIGFIEQDDRERTKTNFSVSTSGGLKFGFSFADTMARCVRAPSGLSLDGTWAAWGKADVLHADRSFQVEEINGVRWQGPQDVSARIRTMWDDRYFYVGVETRDDVFSATNDKALVFLNDALEIGLDLEGRLASDSKLWQICVGQTPAGPVAHRFAPAPAASVPLNARQLVVRRTGQDGNAIYQIAIPWSELGDHRPKPGKRIGFGIIVDDSDGKPADRKFISWFGSGISSKKPQELGELTFVDAD